MSDDYKFYLEHKHEIFLLLCCIFEITRKPYNIEDFVEQKRPLLETDE